MYYFIKAVFCINNPSQCQPQLSKYTLHQIHPEKHSTKLYVVRCKAIYREILLFIIYFILGVIKTLENMKKAFRVPFGIEEMLKIAGATSIQMEINVVNLSVKLTILSIY